MNRPVAISAAVIHTVSPRIAAPTTRGERSRLAGRDRSAMFDRRATPISTIKYTGIELGPMTTSNMQLVAMISVNRRRMNARSNIGETEPAARSGSWSLSWEVIMPRCPLLSSLLASIILSRAALAGVSLTARGVMAGRRRPECSPPKRTEMSPWS